MRLMREIVETRQIHTENVFWFFARMTLNIKGQGQGHQGQKTLCTQDTPAVWTEWNALVADRPNVTQAADATIRSLQRGVFGGYVR